VEEVSKTSCIDATALERKLTREQAKYCEVIVIECIFILHRINKYYYYLFKFSRSIHRFKEQTSGYRTCHKVLKFVPFFETVMLNNKSTTKDIN
jgi:hypothetical protein